MKPIIVIVTLLIGIQLMFGQHENVIIDEINSNHPNEPSIKLDPNNPDYIIAASNINNQYYSEDGGKTWTIQKVQSSFGVWGDPALAVDSKGNFYFFHLSNPPDGHWIDRIICQRSEDSGKTWNNGSFMGLNGSKEQDKEWPAIDRKDNTIYVTWTEFDNYGSANPSDSSHIMFSRSKDLGETWSTAIRINKKAGDCIDDDDTVEGAVPAIGPNGEVYVAWAGPEGIVFDKSLDQGETWLEDDIFVSDNPGGWNYKIPGIYRANGLPVTSCDTSQTLFRGNIYVNWTDQRNGSDDTDVWICRSEDGGESWSEPQRVNNDPPGKHQFFSWMDIDQTNGYIYIVYYDRRNFSDKRTDVYLARSVDGGRTFLNYMISEEPFIPNSGVFFGDYTNITVHNDVIRPIWTRLHEGKLKILTALVDSELLTNDEDIIPYSHGMELEQNYPNPFAGDTYISFKLRQAEKMDLIIYDKNGLEVKPVFRNKSFDQGKHVLRLFEELSGLGGGMYFYVLRNSNGETRHGKMILLD